jgi:hypothetical protein
MTIMLMGLAAWLIMMSPLLWSGCRGSTWYRRWVMRRAAYEGFFCKDCRWAMPDPRDGDPQSGWAMARCMHPSARKDPGNFLAIGEDRPFDMNYCTNQRDFGFGKCGPYGRYWQKGEQVLPPPDRPSLSRYAHDVQEMEKRRWALRG